MCYHNYINLKNGENQWHNMLLVVILKLMSIAYEEARRLLWQNLTIFSYIIGNTDEYIAKIIITNTRAVQFLYSVHTNYRINCVSLSGRQLFNSRPVFTIINLLSKRRRKLNRRKWIRFMNRLKKWMSTVDSKHKLYGTIRTT